MKEFAGIYDTKIGPIFIKAYNDKIIQIKLVNKSFKSELNPSKLTDFAFKELIQYLDKKLTKFTIPYELTGTEFQKSVYREILKVPYGNTSSYANIASSLDSKAYQAVGTAVGSNPLLILVPCHRIIKSNGQMGKFSAGKDIKRYLLNLEDPKNHFSF